MTTTTLFRPVGPLELELIRQSDWRLFPPRLPEQPFFYPVVQESYARAIAERWNVRESGAGFVLRFQVETTWLARYPMQVAGGVAHLEHWIPSDELSAFNEHLVGCIEVIATYPGSAFAMVGSCDGRSC